MRKIRPAVAILALAMVGLLVITFRNSGTFLVVDNREKSDAILITQGDSLDAKYWMGSHLLTDGYGRELLLDARTDRIFFGHSQAEWAIEFIRKTAARLPGQVNVCPITADTTAQEVYEVEYCLKGRSIRSVLLVVDDYHCRRSLAMFSRLLPQYHWSIAAAPDASRFSVHWWRRRVSIRTAIIEWQHMLWWEMVDRWRFAPVAAPLQETDGEISLDRPQQAVESLRRGAQIADDLAARDPNELMSRESLFSAEVIMSNILRHTDPARALQACDRALPRLGEVKNHEGVRMLEVEALAASTYPLQRLGRTAEAQRRLDGAFARLREAKAYPAERITPGAEADEALTALADFEAANSRISRAIDIYQELLDKVTASQPKPENSLTDAVELSRLYSALADLHRRAGQTAPAASVEARRLELWQKWDHKLPNSAFIQRQLSAANRVNRSAAVGENVERKDRISLENTLPALRKTLRLPTIRRANGRPGYTVVRATIAPDPYNLCAPGGTVLIVALIFIIGCDR